MASNYKLNYKNMIEKINYKPRQEIKWPQTAKVEVGNNVDFVYIMRKDGNFTMSPVVRRLATEYALDEGATKQILLEEYDTYFSKLADILKWGYSPKGSMELHLYDPAKLDKSVREKIGGLPTVSLDPLMNKGVFELGVSRGFYMGGRKDFGQVARPGTDPLSKQADGISLVLNSALTAVAEDDIFTGGSVAASLTELKKSGVNVQKAVTGIQVDEPTSVLKMGVSVEAVVTYETADGAKILDKVDLGDPRDYLLGASGLVIKLPSGKFGRAPYILPFVSSAARAGIPTEMEKEFAQKVLQANLEFYIGAGERIGKPILLKSMDPNFVIYMVEMYGFNPNTSMETIAAWSMDNLDKLSDMTKLLGELQAKNVESLALPKNTVYLDVNGTLIPEDSADGYISEDNVGSLQEAVAAAEEKGLAVGLCSDSPLPQIQKFAAKLGISGPIIAENGNVVFNNGGTIIVNEIESLDEIKKKILSKAGFFGYKQGIDVVAPEFGGNTIPSDGDLWSFGANRETSVTVFGSQELITYLGTVFVNSAEYGVDVSPENGYFAIHPGTNFRLNKGRTLSALTAFGYNAIMVGNSKSDWVDPTSGVQCAFVAESRISEEIANKAAYVSDKPLVEGVVDILNSIK